MKNYFHISLMIVLVMTVSLPASAQYYRIGRPIPPSKRASCYSQHQYGAGRDGDTYFGLRLGFGVSTVSSDNTTFDTNKSKTGLNVGVAVGTQLTSQAPVFLESGLYYTEKGGKSTHNGTRFTYNLDYLEAPLLVKYKVYPSRDVSVEPFFGGYLACGIAGKIKDYNNREAYSSFGDEDDTFNRFDGGLRFGCGVSYQMLYLEASYDLGLANVGKDSFDDARNRCFNLTVGVNF